jgi:hypothetical protein
MAEYPNVPAVPGVPPLQRQPGVPLPSLPVLLLADLILSIGANPGIPQWGLFDQFGDSVIAADNVLDFNYKKSYRVAKYPIEQGGFQSYNKVQEPFDIIFRFTCGGSAADRQAFLDSIAAIQGDTNLYTAVTPEEVYQNCNVEDVSYPRTAEKVGLITLEVRLTQIIPAPSPAFSNTQSPSGASPVNTGTVQPTDPSNSQQQEIDAGVN